MLESMKLSTLSHQRMFRPGSSSNGCTVAERTSADFLVDGQSLLQILTKKDGGRSDYMGCFARGFDEPSARSLSKLTVEMTERLLSPQKQELHRRRPTAKIRVSWKTPQSEPSLRPPSPGRKTASLAPIRDSQQKNRRNNSRRSFTAARSMSKWFASTSVQHLCKRLI